MKAKRFCALLLVMAMMLSCVGISANAENNHSDTIVTISEVSNSGGNPMGSFYRGKWDYSSSYIYNYPESGGSLKAWVNSAPTSNYNKLIDRWYCHIWGGQRVPYNGPSDYVWVAKGEYKYLNNYCREDYYAYSGYDHAPYTTTGDPVASVGFICYTEHKYYKLAWSPDSV